MARADETHLGASGAGRKREAGSTPSSDPTPEPLAPFGQGGADHVEPPSAMGADLLGAGLPTSGEGAPFAHEGDDSLANPDSSAVGLGEIESADPAVWERVAEAQAAAQALTPRRQLEAWLAGMIKANASDLILRAGGRPCVRVDGRIEFLEGRVPNAGAMYEVLEGIVGKYRIDELRDRGSCDVALALDGLGRFRLNAYRQMSEPAVVLRRIANDPPDLIGLNLPDNELTRLAMRKRGLILVTGIAGSGKSTTLAGMIQYMNRHAERHIVTLEDPVELIYTEERCVISQREIGTDCPSFHEGLRHALRQSPDVILIGEMRDGETVSAALDASETGHLVLSTLHTVNASQTMDRILGFFPSEQHSQVCMRLAENLSGVLSQRLLPRREGRGMVPACELMTTTPRVRELVEKGQTIELARTIEQGTEQGLISFNQSLRAHVEQGLVDLDVALAASDRPDELLLALRGFRAGTKETRPPPSGTSLRMTG